MKNALNNFMVATKNLGKEIEKGTTNGFRWKRFFYLADKKTREAKISAGGLVNLYVNLEQAKEELESINSGDFLNFFNPDTKNSEQREYVIKETIFDDKKPTHITIIPGYDAGYENNPDWMDGCIKLYYDSYNRNDGSDNYIETYSEHGKLQTVICDPDRLRDTEGEFIDSSIWINEH